VSHAGCLRHAVSALHAATPMLLSHQHLVFSAAGLTRLLPCFPLSSRAKPSAQPVSVSRSRATGCITLAEFLQAKITSRLKFALCLTSGKKFPRCAECPHFMPPLPPREPSQNQPADSGHSLQTKDTK